MALHLGSVVPDFTQESTEGPIHFHEWIGNHWAILFSHPKDFTPVCTTELGVVAKLKPEFDKRNVKVIGLSVDDVDSHKRWIKDIEETQHTRINYPILGDPDRKVFIIDPQKKLRLSITYPASTGRNFQELLRVIDSLQLTDHHSVATPADWKEGEDCVIVPSITDPKVMKEKFPKGWKELKPYLRMTPQPNK
jgi:alkyl hydroperoxide reductase subunit AhpC